MGLYRRVLSSNVVECRYAVDNIFSSIHLTQEADTVTTTGVVNRHRDNGEEVVEGLAELLVVGDRSLNLLSSKDSLVHTVRGDLV
jgi:hypothetical protein